MTVLLAALICTVQTHGTFSIVAMDTETGEFGVAVASKVLDVGYVVPWLKADIGAVATQAYANPYYGPWALEAMEQGRSADEALQLILERDTIPEQRQVAIVDASGLAVAHTGDGTLAWSGHKTADGVSVQGNILTGPEVIDSMLAVFQRTRGPLAERLLKALKAGENAGGDKRGKQSAALQVVIKNGGLYGVDDRLVDLKVVDNDDPVTELQRIYDKWQYWFLSSAYLRLADTEKGRSAVFLERVHAFLEHALEEDLEDAGIYNSLAWEFALRQMYPEQTLQAAHKAHDLDPEAHYIMDTLAEAYYAAGDYEQAIFWEKEALKKEPENKFYHAQLKKFEDALSDLKEKR